MPVLNVCFLLWGTIKHGALIRKLVAFFFLYEQLVFEGIDGRPKTVYRSN